jgi:hypothetical protein
MPVINWNWFTPAGSPAGSYAIVADPRPGSGGTKALSIATEYLAGYYNGKNNFLNCEIDAWTKALGNDQNSQFFVRWNPTALGDGYLVAIADHVDGKKAYVIGVVAGVQTLLGSSAKIIVGHLDWTRWRIRVKNILNPFLRARWTVEYHDGIDFVLLYQFDTDTVMASGYCGFGDAYAVAGLVASTPRFDDLALATEAP